MQNETVACHSYGKHAVGAERASAGRTNEKTISNRNHWRGIDYVGRPPVCQRSARQRPTPQHSLDHGRGYQYRTCVLRSSRSEDSQPECAGPPGCALYASLLYSSVLYAIPQRDDDRRLPDTNRYPGPTTTRSHSSRGHKTHHSPASRSRLLHRSRVWLLSQDRPQLQG